MRQLTKSELRLLIVNTFDNIKERMHFLNHDESLNQIKKLCDKMSADIDLYRTLEDSQ